ncbi:MAG TPA: glycosyltransferase [Steroidobacteraceae bacterium]|nr:glycosyltransferase [Steroidobacteraceae bacterium]
MSAATSPPLIVHVIHRLDFGGLENGLVNLVNRLPRERFRHAIVCLAGFNPAYRQRIARNDVEVVSLDKRPGKGFGVYLRMWRTLRRLRPQVVHTRNLGTVDMQWVAFAAGVPCRVHGEHGWEASDPRGRNRRHLAIRRACRPVIQRFVPMSADIADWLRTSVGVDPACIRQLYSGVDTHRFTPSPARAGEGGGEGPAPGEGSSPLPLAGEVDRRSGEGSGGEGPLTIGTIGRLDPVKNQAALIDAVHALRHRFPRLRLLIVGDGPLRDALRRHAADAGLADAVEFTGARSDTPDLLRRMDLFVLPSINEGISNTILEAMATGLPVVATRVGGNPELVADGATGALYDPARAGALEDALVPYLADAPRRHAHGRAGRERVVQNFSLEAMVQRYQALYDELLKDQRPSPRPSSALAGEGGRRPGEGI